MLISPLLPTGYISPTEHAFWFPRNRPFLHCKTKKFESLEKIRIGKNCEIHIAKKLPFLNEKSILPNILPFSKIFCQKLGKHLPYFLSSIWQPCALLAVSRFGFRVSWLSALVLVALWTCHWSPRHFADLALVFFVISHANFCLQTCWTDDGSLTRNWFPSKAKCDQIRLRRPCGVLMLICGCVQSESSQVMQAVRGRLIPPLASQPNLGVRFLACFTYGAKLLENSHRLFDFAVFPKWFWSTHLERSALDPGSLRRLEIVKTHIDILARWVVFRSLTEKN